MATPLIPAQLLGSVTKDELADVEKWWSGLSHQQRVAVEHLLNLSDCVVQFESSEGPHADIGQLLNAEETVRRPEDWEVDWREYLTEHTNVRLMTMSTRCCVVSFQR